MKTTRILAEITLDVMVLGGIGFLFYGAFLIYRPLGYIVLGACLLGMGAYFLGVIKRRGPTNGRTIDDVNQHRTSSGAAEGPG